MFAKALKGQNIDELLTAISAAPVAAAGPAAGAPAAGAPAAKEESK
jgi:ribosomal protein L12E/L44/L45/RPP1/RPP2